MKKFALLIVAGALFASACSTDSTIDLGAEGPEASSDKANATTAPESAAQDDEGKAEDTASGAQADDSTPSPASEEPTSAPVKLAPGAAKAIQAVVDADDWCSGAIAVENVVSSLDSLNFSDPVEVERGFRQWLAAISAMKRLVPSEISADLDRSIEAFTIFATAFEDVDWMFLDLDSGIVTSFEERTELANYNIEAYNFAECGFGPDPGPAPAISDDGTVEGDDDGPGFDGTIREQALQGLFEAGFNAEEANCIFESMDLTNPNGSNDAAAVLAVFAGCGISLDRLGQLAG